MFHKQSLAGDDTRDDGVSARVQDMCWDDIGLLCFLSPQRQQHSLTEML